MSTLVESLRRLYQSDKVTSQKLVGLRTKGTISQEEYDYIVG